MLTESEEGSHEELGQREPGVAYILGYTSSSTDSRKTANADPEAGEETSKEDLVWRIVDLAGRVE